MKRLAKIEREIVLGVSLSPGAREKHHYLKHPGGYEQESVEAFSSDQKA